MAFALRTFQAFGQQVPVPINMSGYQSAYFEITGTAADVDLDFSDFSGTLWTALSATAGGHAAKEAMQQIQDQVLSLLAISSEQLVDRVQVASLTTTGQKLITVTDHLPDIAVNAGDGETLWQILFQWNLSPGNYGVNLDILPSAS